MHVGGEFSNDRRWKLAERKPFPYQTGLTYFLNGGQACLRVIADWLCEHGIRRILLPSYLCPTISGVFAQYGMKMEFYRIREDFSVDLDHLHQLAAAYPNPAIYFINYFGFTPSQKEIAFLLELQHSKLILVEDNAQAGFHEHPIGDFVFNSLRKLCPFDGAYLQSRFPLQETIDRYKGQINHRLPLIRRYREQYARYLAGEDIEPEVLDELFAQSESYYAADKVVAGDGIEQVGIESLDWLGIRQARRDNFDYLVKAVTEITEITPVYSELQESNIPFGLPVYFTKVSRDAVNRLLGNARIGLTIHWEEMHKPPLTTPQAEAMAMSQRLLTLAVDQYTDRAQLDYLVKQLCLAIIQVKKG